MIRARHGGVRKDLFGCGTRKRLQRCLKIEYLDGRLFPRSIDRGLIEAELPDLRA